MKQSHAPRSALGMAVNALTLMVGRRLAMDVERYDSSCTLHVVPPLCPLEVSPVDFSQGAELIERSYRSTIGWLAAGMTSLVPEAELVHSHVHASAAT